MTGSRIQRTFQKLSGAPWRMDHQIPRQAGAEALNSRTQTQEGVLGSSICPYGRRSSNISSPHPSLRDTNSFSESCYLYLCLSPSVVFQSVTVGNFVSELFPHVLPPLSLRPPSGHPSRGENVSGPLGACACRAAASKTGPLHHRMQRRRGHDTGGKGLLSQVIDTHFLGAA